MITCEETEESRSEDDKIFPSNFAILLSCTATLAFKVACKTTLHHLATSFTICKLWLSLLQHVHVHLHGPFITRV